MSTVFITGISRGIGLGLAEKYLSDGRVVIGSVRSEKTAAELESRYGPSLKALTFDVTERHSVESSVASIATEHPKIDLLICNAALNPDEPFVIRQIRDIPDEDFVSSFNINVVGTVRVVRALYPQLAAAASPKVVAISSGLASLEWASDGSQIPYSVSKSALNMLCVRLQCLFAVDNIPVLALNPGWVQTDMGGPEAQITVEESVTGMVGVIEAFSLGDPQFQDYKGDRQRW